MRFVQLCQYSEAKGFMAVEPSGLKSIKQSILLAAYL